MVVSDEFQDTSDEQFELVTAFAARPGFCFSLISISAYTPTFPA